MPYLQLATKTTNNNGTLPSFISVEAIAVAMNRIIRFVSLSSSSSKLSITATAAATPLVTSSNFKNKDGGTKIEENSKFNNENNNHDNDNIDDDDDPWMNIMIHKSPRFAALFHVFVTKCKDQIIEAMGGDISELIDAASKVRTMGRSISTALLKMQK